MDTHLLQPTDTFNFTVEKDITIFVTPNSTPIFRETSVSGNQITNVTKSLNESSSDGTLVKRIFFTDLKVIQLQLIHHQYHLKHILQ